MAELHIKLPDELKERLAVAADEGVPKTTKTAVVIAALEQWLGEREHHGLQRAELRLRPTVLSPYKRG